MNISIHQVHRKQFSIVQVCNSSKNTVHTIKVNIVGFICLHIIIDTTMHSVKKIATIFFLCKFSHFTTKISFPFPFFTTWIIIIDTIKSLGKGDEKDYVPHCINIFAPNCGCGDFWLADLHFYSPFVIRLNFILFSFKLVIFRFFPHFSSFCSFFNLSFGLQKFSAWMDIHTWINAHLDCILTMLPSIVHSKMRLVVDH